MRGWRSWWCRAAAAPGLLLALFVLESIRGAGLDAPVTDEAVTIASGFSFLRTGRQLLNPEEPMLGKALLAAPLLWLRPSLDLESDAWRHGVEWVAAYEFLWENRVPGLRLVRFARLPTIACGVLLLGLVLAAATWLYGRAAGLLALLVAATCPDLLGHSHLATLDVPLALVSTLALAALLWYAERPSRGRHVLLSLALGALLATKASAYLLLGGLGAAAVARALVDPDLARRGSIRPPRLTSRRLASWYVLGGGFLLAAAYGVILSAALYAGSPSAWLLGAAGNLAIHQGGHPAYLHGAVSTDGFVTYYFQALAVKLPVLTLALLLASLLTWPALRLGRERIEVPALAFAVLFLILAGLGSAQAGVRYVLPVYPVIFVLAARLMAARFAWPALSTGLGAVVAGSALGAAAAARPTYLSYVNELHAARGLGPGRDSGGIASKQARRGRPALLEANLDWGQDLGRLAEWLRSRGSPPVALSLFSNTPPAAYGLGYQALPAAGPVLPPSATSAPGVAPQLVCVSANNLHGLFFRRDLFAEVRALRPRAVIGGSIECFSLADLREGHLLLARLYRGAGWWQFAAREAGLAQCWGATGAPFQPRCWEAVPNRDGLPAQPVEDGSRARLE